jgi:hypothetical protein
MIWITREKPEIDRLACPWLIRKFVDPEAEIIIYTVLFFSKIWAKLKSIPNKAGRISTLLLLFLFHLNGFSQFPVNTDSLYTFIKYNSIHRDIVSWDSMDTAHSKCLVSAKNDLDTLQCFVQILRALDDIHSNITYKNKNYGHYHPVEDSVYIRIKPLLDLAAQESGKISMALLPDQNGYIRIPGIQAFGETEVNRYARIILDSLSVLATQKMKQIVIDLRLNTGGNLYPMLSGLSPLLGDGIIGYETDVEGTIVRSWEIKKNNFFIGEYQTTSIPDSFSFNLNKMPVVILTGPLTGSSGTMTAIAFKHRPNTFFIGEATTEGYTTSNGYFWFSPDFTMNFATNFVADRKKILYKKAFNPDLYIPGGDNFTHLQLDEKLHAATEFFKKN